MIDIFDVEFTADFAGAKSSEGDGRTAADLEAEQACGCGCGQCSTSEEASDGAS